jgi:hypothetical protein
MLDRQPEGIQCGNGKQGVSVVIHTDDRTLFLMYEQVVRLALELIRNYEGAKGARLNLRKSKAVAVVSWDISVFATDILYYKEITILGVRFAQTAMKSSTLSWTLTTRKVNKK